MFGLSIIDTVFVVIGGMLLLALYKMIRSDESWFQVRMGGLIFVCLMVLVPLLLLRCNADVFGAYEVNVDISSAQAYENVLEMKAFSKE